MPNPYDDYEHSGQRGERDRWGRERGRTGERYSSEPEWRRPEPWQGSERAGERGEETRYSGGRGLDEFSRAPHERDTRAARDTLEGGDLGWHGGVRGAEGGGGYGGGFFGTAYGLYAGRPERVEPGRGRYEQGREDIRGAEERRLGRGPKGYRRSDDRIHDEVCERIARSGVNADEVEVKVENGEVTLTGTVERREDKWRLESLCDSVFGVDDVHNQLRSSDRSRREPDVTGTH